MPTISTDDASRRLIFIWKGPAETPFFFDARGQAWAAGLLLIPVACIAAWALSSPIEMLPTHQAVASLLHIAVAVAIGSSAAIWLIRRVGAHVDPTRPVRHHAALLVSEVTARRYDDNETTTHTEPSNLWVSERAEDTLFLAPTRKIT